MEEEEFDYSDDEHEVFDEMPVRVRHLNFVKLLHFESPNIDAMIKKAEERIEKIDQDQVLLAQKIRKRVMDSDDVRVKLSMISYSDTCELTPNWHRDRLDILHLSLDKLTFANNAYKEKSIISCFSGGEVDKQKLSFLMVHGCKNMADERKILREVNASQGKDRGITVEELHAPIQRLKEKMCYNYWDYEKATENIARDKAILKDIKQLKIAREEAIADAVVNGKLWDSLGSRDAVRAELQALNNNSDVLEKNQVKVNAKLMKVKKELQKVERDISSLQKRLTNTNRQKEVAYNMILKLKKTVREEYESTGEECRVSLDISSPKSAS